jgi:hypothetical protein
MGTPKRHFQHQEQAIRTIDTASKYPEREMGSGEVKEFYIQTYVVGKGTSCLVQN